MKEGQKISNGGETVILESQYLISKTDLDGRIVYANPSFIEVSGFSREELLGQHHNIVRHPDMPSEVFKDFWETIKNGQPWAGVVKNRTKDGGYYWVHALVSPITEAGLIKGYASVRVKPSPKQVLESQNLYSKIRLNQLKGYQLSAGILIPTGWRKVLSLLKMPFSTRLVARTTRAFLISALGSAGLTYFLLDRGAMSPFIIGSLIALLAVGGALYVQRLIQGLTKPIENAALLAQQIASGNLLVDIGTGNSNSEEVKHLYFTLGLMRQGLNAIATDSLEGTQFTKNIALVLNQDNVSLADRAQEQSAAIQETAASMEELTVTVQQNADNATEAATLSNQNLAIVMEGDSAVNNMVSTMQGIQKSSNQIAEIVNLIEGVAFQTNILALNAAIESARAGEAGRGFAVVANEVRGLAQRSSQAAGEIKDLIERSVSEITEGVKQATSTSHSMTAITDGVEKVNRIVSEISSASEEQSTGLGQIYQAISLLEESTQKNSDLATHLSESVGDLSHRTELLEESMKVLVTKAKKQ